MDNIKQRLLQYAKTQKIGMMKFYEKISVSQSNFSGKGGDSALSTDKIIHILITFDDINPDWLLLGKGKMLRKLDNVMADAGAEYLRPQPQSSYDGPGWERYDAAQQEIGSLRERLAQAEANIATLRSVCDDKKTPSL